MSIESRNQLLSQELDSLKVARDKGVDGLGERASVLANISGMLLVDGQFSSGLKFLQYAIQAKFLEIQTGMIASAEAKLPSFEAKIDSATTKVVQFIDSLHN